MGQNITVHFISSARKSDVLGITKVYDLVAISTMKPNFVKTVMGPINYP